MKSHNKSDGAALADSNMANYGSKEHIEARKKAAQSEKEFAGSGTKVGLEIWRVENRRTASDTPDFGVKRWPEPGSFYTGDSYLLLNTYYHKDPVTKKVTDKLAWDVHFWLGNESSQDEIGVAAYKAVELDDLLDDAAVQHREVQGSESQLFLSYFSHGIKYMSGGIASGFRHVKPDEYKSRLFEVRRTHGTIRASEVPVSAKSLNHGCVFVLDAGKKVYVMVGDQASPFEKMKAGMMQLSIVDGRDGHSTAVQELDDEFWKILGGTAKDVAPAEKKQDTTAAAHSEGPHEHLHGVEPDKVVLYRLSDASGKLTFTKEKEGSITLSHLTHTDVFIIDANIQLFVWVGSQADHLVKSQAMKHATDYLTMVGKPLTMPVTRIKDGQVHIVFSSLLPA